MRKKSFTLIELAVTIGILIVIAGASMPALFVHQKRAQLEEATTQLKDAILSVQNFAMAPDNINASDYRLILNTNETSPVTVLLACPTGACPHVINPHSYAIFRVLKNSGSLPGQLSLGFQEKISEGTLPDKVEIANPPCPSPPSSDETFIINFRVSDKAVGFRIYYYDVGSAWGPLWPSPECSNGYATITLTEPGSPSPRIIKINNITGAMIVESA